jgi:TolB-like protein
VAYNDPASNPLRAGRELSVDYVLDGRIKMLGNRVRVSLQLLDVQRAANSWADQFDENYTEPKLDPLRHDPRFNELFRRTNNPLALR